MGCCAPRNRQARGGHQGRHNKKPAHDAVLPMLRAFGMTPLSGQDACGMGLFPQISQIEDDRIRFRSKGGGFDAAAGDPWPGTAPPAREAWAVRISKGGVS